MSEEFLNNGRPKKSYGAFKNTAPRTAPSSVTYAVGDTVLHKAFGKGTIIKADKMGNDQMLQISFENGATKTLMANFSKMEKL